MLITVENFKSIESAKDIDLSGLTVLAGVNSSGKSSLIQALLLLKQTLTRPYDGMLNLKGPYVYADSPADLIYGKKTGSMYFGLKMSGHELWGTEITNGIPDDFLKSLKVGIRFRVQTAGYFIEEFEIEALYENDIRETLMLSRKSSKGPYTIVQNGKKKSGLRLDNYSFANFFPIYASKDDVIYDLSFSKTVHSSLATVLGKVTYIAPLRVAPVLSRTYQSEVETRHVLPDGENTRFILDKMTTEDKGNLALVKEWLCDRFHLAKDLDIVKESGKRYRAIVTTNDGIKVDLMHMGFGLSQILPIITQGAISESESLLIVEDPDVHMHPGIQAAMADFFIYLCKRRNVSVLVETHSDHFVTRIRRRIAEKAISKDLVNLIFVLNGYGSSDYKSIPLLETGRMTGSMPPGFLDSLDKDFRAILEANRK